MLALMLHKCTQLRHEIQSNAGGCGGGAEGAKVCCKPIQSCLLLYSLRVLPTAAGYAAAYACCIMSACLLLLPPALGAWEAARLLDFLLLYSSARCSFFMHRGR